MSDTMSDASPMTLSGWGRYPRGASELVEPRAPAEITRALSDPGPIIARGAGRSYGDPAIGFGRTISALHLNRMIAFDPDNGRLTAEAGVLLADIIATFGPRGFFPPVVPGTKHVTLGGMIASHVHGKNHHQTGGFGAHVERLTLLLPAGERKTCSISDNPELFRATIGGMGLTGIILDATFKLMPVETGFIVQQTLMAPDLDTLMAQFQRTRASTYSVAWIDSLARGASLGRGVLLLGEHAKLADLEFMERVRAYPAARSRFAAVPFEFPSFVLNRMSVSAFNAAYYANAQRHEGTNLVPWEPYFFPLDAIGGWNKIYGRRGFIQYQCVIPKEKSRDGIGELLERASGGSPSFLSVLKLLGPDEAGLLGFPMEGYTLTLDFPVSEASLRLASALDLIVLKYGGRLYLAKDARQGADMFAAGYPRLTAFRTLRRDMGAAQKFRSLQSDRLGL